MARMTKEEKWVENQVQAAYSKHFNRVQVNMMDLGKIMDIGKAALKEGRDLDEAMIAAVAQYRQN
jgi:hypothetical protein